jgi:hypothetical protein
MQLLRPRDSLPVYRFKCIQRGLPLGFAHRRTLRVELDAIVEPVTPRRVLPIYEVRGRIEPRAVDQARATSAAR